MEKVNGVAGNLAGFFQDIVKFIEAIWKYIEKFFGSTEAPEEPLTNEALF